MPTLEYQPGKIGFVSSSKHKSKSKHKTHPDSRDRKIEELQRQLDNAEEQRDQAYLNNQSLKESKRIAVEDSKAFKQMCMKYKKELDEMKDEYEDLHERYEKRGEDIKQRDKIIRQKDGEIRSKDKEIEELRVEKKVQVGTIKQVEERNTALHERVAIVSDEKKRSQQEVTMRRATEEKLNAENKSLKEENARLRDWKLAALEREARLRREREEAEYRGPPRRRYDY
jgi:chromosome segregation ATPase